MRRMTAGFAFTDDERSVLLVHKRRGPPVVKGRLNGIGGHIEGDETPLEAQVREFREETGLDIAPERWTHTVHLSGPHGGGWEVWFYRCDITEEEAASYQAADEPLTVVPVEAIPTMNVVPNLRWLVPMQNDRLRYPVVLEEKQ